MKFISRTISIGLLAYAILFVFISNGWGKQNTPISQPTVAEKKHGGTFRDSVLSGITSFDPVKTLDVATLRVGLQIYQPLVEIDEDLNVVPLLAETWETPDNKKWVFHIRDGVKFHDDPCFEGGKGRVITAHDVKYSFERLMNPKTRTVGSWIFTNIVAGAKDYFEGKSKDIKGFNVTGERTFAIELTKPFYPLLTRLSLYLCSIVPREAVEKYKEDFGLHPVGTGPFVLSKFVPDQEIILTKNEHYWERSSNGLSLPYLDRVKIRFIREEMLQFKEFEAGNLDVSDIPTPVYPMVVDTDKKLKKRYSEFRLKRAAALEVHYYVMIMTQKPLGKNKALRQAINYAINKDAIIKSLLKGRATPARGVLPPGLPSYNPNLKGYPYNLELAKKKLAEAGYPAGKGLPTFTLVVDSGTISEAVASAVQSQLMNVGIQVKLETTQFNTLIEMAVKETAPMFRLWFAATYPQAELFFVQFLSGYYPPLGFNFARYSNAEFDALLGKATGSINEDERIKFYRDAEEIVVSDAPWVFLYYPEAAKILQPDVVDYQFNGLQLPKYKYVWLNK